MGVGEYNQGFYTLHSCPLGSINITFTSAVKRAEAGWGLLLKPGTGRDKRGISRPVPPTKTRDGIEFYCKRIRRKGSRLAPRRQASANVRGSIKER